MGMMDLTTMTDQEVQDLHAAAGAEVRRRAVLAAAPERVESVQRDTLEAEGIKPGDPWQQPTGAHNAYPAGFIVTHAGVRYESLIPANTTTPGDPDDPQAYRWWESLTPEPDTAWDGQGVAYEVGDLVTFEGITYEAIQAHTSQPGWTPPAVPALWSPVTGPS